MVKIEFGKTYNPEIVEEMSSTPGPYFFLATQTRNPEGPTGPLMGSQNSRIRSASAQSHNNWLTVEAL